MIVVADSSPLHYLILIGQTELLHRFYNEVLIPDAVASELSAAQSPSAVRGWLLGPPAWLRVMAALFYVPKDAYWEFVRSSGSLNVRFPDVLER